MENLNLVFLDTETTGGSETELIGTYADIPGGKNSDGEGLGDRITQIAWILNNNEEVVDEKFCPPVPVSIGSMVVTGITPEELADKPTFIESKTHARLLELAADTNNVFVAHNAKFDIAMVGKEGVQWSGPVLDTYRVLMHIAPELESHSMQFYRYNFKLYLKEPAEIEKVGKEIKPHDALGDIIVLKLLVEDLLEKGYTIEQMIELTNTLVFHQNWRFGKYKGQNIIESAKVDPGYVLYMLANEQDKEESKQDKDLLYTLKRVTSEMKLLGQVMFNFGKYKGISVAEVATSDHPYLVWLYESETAKPKEERKMRGDMFMAIEAYANNPQ